MNRTVAKRISSGARKAKVFSGVRSRSTEPTAPPIRLGRNSRFSHP